MVWWWICLYCGIAVTTLVLCLLLLWYLSRLYYPVATVITNTQSLAPLNGEHACIVFTDIQSSSLLWVTLGTSCMLVVQMHNRLIREAVNANHGYEVRTIGDSFLLVFKEVDSAIQASLQIQRTMQNNQWPAQIHHVYSSSDEAEYIPCGPLVRIGIHIGLVVVHNDHMMSSLDIQLVHCIVDPTTGRFDYYGIPVNTASRICGAAHGAEILLSEEVMELCGYNVSSKGFVPLCGVPGGGCNLWLLNEPL